MLFHYMWNLGEEWVRWRHWRRWERYCRRYWEDRGRPWRSCSPICRGIAILRRRGAGIAQASLPEMSRELTSQCDRTKVTGGRLGPCIRNAMDLLHKNKIIRSNIYCHYYYCYILLNSHYHSYTACFFTTTRVYFLNILKTAWRRMMRLVSF